MNYSQEEIERKRLLALQRKRETQLRNGPSPEAKKFKSNASPTSYCGTSSSSNVRINENRQTNTGNTPGQRRSQEYNYKQHFNDTRTNYNRNGLQKQPTSVKTETFFGNKQRVTGKFSIISDNRFMFATTTFFQPIVETLKTIPTSAYDMKTKSWNFDLKDYELLMNKIAPFKSDINLEEIPSVVLQMFRTSNTAKSKLLSIDLSNMEPKLLESLMPFQREGICYGISKNGRCMIADDMGLGKTLQALGIAYHFRENWPLLIVAPSSVRYQWSEAIHNFLPSIPAQFVYHFTNGKDLVDFEKIVITSYDLLVRAVDTFERYTFGFIILDESHVLKSIKTARYIAAQRVTSRARHVVLLSGTPALSRPIELYSQINLIIPRFMRYQDYGIRYCAGEKTTYGWNFTGSSNLSELQMLLKNNCMIRRLKNDTLDQLPTKKREVIMLDPDLVKAGTKEMLEMSKQMERKVLTGLEQHTALIHYYNESSIAKQKAICNYVSKLFAERKKCLIFAHHQNILDAVCDLAESMKIKFIRIDGKTSSERRKYQVDKFQSSDAYLTAVLSITAANTGITLTAAQLVVFAELFWNPGVLCQAEDRVYRIGQGENVRIQYLVAKHTADDYLWPLIQRKLNVLNEAGLDQDFSLHDASIKQNPSKGNQKLDSFLTNKKTNKVPTDETTVQSSVSENSSPVTIDEMKELIQLKEEEFNFCDWDDIP